MNTVLSSISTSSLVELCSLCYCAARVVTEECGVKLSNNKPQSSPPPWEVRILSRLKRLKQDLSCLYEFNRDRLLSQQKCRFEAVLVHHGFFLLSATFQTYCPSLTSLAGCRTWCPTDLQHKP